jgi:hypothetical protein
VTHRFLIPVAPEFFSATTPCNNKQEAHVPLSVNMPNGTTIQSSHTCDLLLTDLPPQERKAHILPGLVHESLISVGQLCDSGCDSRCDSGCDVTLTQEQVTVSRDGKCVIYGSRDPRSRLWRVDLKKKFETKKCTV